MVNISIDVTDLGGEARPGDKVVFWRPRMGGSATHAGRVISTAPVTVFLTDGKATVSNVEPGEMTVLLQCRGVESQGPVTVGVPDGDHTVTLRALLESQFEYAPPIVSAVQEAADNAAASERAAIEAQVRSEAAADRADAKVDDAINNGANLVRDEVKQDADRAVAARQAAVQAESNAAASENAAASSASNAATSETNAKQSETNAGEFAAVATTAATEAVDAMEEAALSAAAFKIYTGIGSPEGKVAAPVGSVYTDSAATTGAIRWIKASGTGNTGWRVEYGDTGWRDISSSIVNRSTPAAFADGAGIQIRRVQDTVQYRIFGGITVASQFGKLTDNFTGFRPKGDGQMELISRAADLKAGTWQIRLENGISGEKLCLAGESRLMMWGTEQPWPSTLPGTPA